MIGQPYPLKALIAGNNPMAQWPNQERTREAFKALDLLVHIDLFQNETSAFADYVLPAAPLSRPAISARPATTAASSGSTG